MTKKQTKKNLSSVSSHYDVFYCSPDTVLQNESATAACDRFRRLLSDHGGSSGGRQRSQLCPMRLGALRPSALVYLHNDASMTDCWCSLNRLGGDEPDAHLHSAGIETWREKEWKCFMHNVPLKNYSWHYGIFFFVRDTSNLLNPKRPVFKSVACFYDPKGNEKLFKAYCFVPVLCVCVPVMCVAERVLVESEQLPQLLQRKMSLYVLLLIHHTAAQSLLMSLPLQDLLLNSSRLYTYTHGERATPRPTDTDTDKCTNSSINNGKR